MFLSAQPQAVSDLKLLDVNMQDKLLICSKSMLKKNIGKYHCGLLQKGAC